MDLDQVILCQTMGNTELESFLVDPRRNTRRGDIPDEILLEEKTKCQLHVSPDILCFVKEIA